VLSQTLQQFVFRLLLGRLGCCRFRLVGISSNIVRRTYPPGECEPCFLPACRP